MMYTELFMYGILVQCTGPFGIKESKGLIPPPRQSTKFGLFNKGKERKKSLFVKLSRYCL